MITSILRSVNKRLGIMPEDKSFDDDVIPCINRAFSTLTDIGVGPKDGYRITSDIETWAEFIDGAKNMEDVQTYVYLRVKMVFDPPLSQSVIAVMKEDIKELEWRLNARVD